MVKCLALPNLGLGPAKRTIAVWRGDGTMLTPEELFTSNHPEVGTL